MKTINWGILGPGIIANQFAHDFQYVTNAKLVAVASKSEERAKKFADKYQIPKYYVGYENILADTEIDAVYIATPHNFHFDMCKMALNAGKAVLSEKPITVNTAELEELIKIAKANNVYLAEGMWTYFLPSVRKAKQWLDEGLIGKVKHIKSDFGYKQEYNLNSRLFNPDLAGGAILDIGVYNVAMAWLFNPEMPKNITAKAELAETGVDCDTQMFFDYETVRATLHCTFMCKLHNFTYVIGDKGYIAIHDFWRSKECFLYENEKVVKHFIDPNEGFGFNHEIEAVSNELLQNKKQSDIMPHSNSLAFQKLMGSALELVKK